MHFLIWTLLPVTVSAFVEKKNRFFFFSSCFVVLYTFLLGLQFDVGSDYFSYLNLLENNAYDKFYLRGEIFSYYVMKLSSIIGHGNLYYFISGFIISTATVLISKNLPGNKYNNLMILMSSWTVLFSAYNTTRQITACVIIILGLTIMGRPISFGKTYLFKKSNIFWKMMIGLFATGFHGTAIFGLSTIFFINVFRNYKKIVIFLAISIFFVGNYLVVELLNSQPLYQIYLVLDEPVTFSTTIGKFYPSGVFFLFCIFKDVKLRELFYNNFFVLYVISLTVIILAFYLQQRVLARFYDYFSIFSLLPYFVLVVKLSGLKKTFFWFLLLLFPVIKITIFSGNEYFYQSILLK